MPSLEVLQTAVAKGYMFLQFLEKEFGQDADLTPAARGAANAAIAGCIAFDTFAGRPGEWAIMEFAYAKESIFCCCCC